jgi:hypothetical protein
MHESCKSRLHPTDRWFDLPTAYQPLQGYHQSFKMPPNCSQPVSCRLTLFLAHVISSTLKMEKTRSSETSAYSKPTRRRIPEDGVIHSHRREILKSYADLPSLLHLTTACLEGPLHVVFSIPQLFRSSYAPVYLSAPSSETSAVCVLPIVRGQDLLTLVEVYVILCGFPVWKLIIQI